MKTESMNKLKSGAITQMVTVAVEYILHQPIRDIIPKNILHTQSMLFLQNLVSNTQMQEWMENQLLQVRSHIPEGTPADFFPDALQQPLREALQEEIVLDADFIHQLIDHKTIESLFHDVLSSVLTDFTETIKTWSTTAASMGPSGVTKGFGRLKAFGDKVMQQTPIGAITQLIEQQAQQKIMGFLDASIASTMQLSAQQIAAPENRKAQALYRLHVMNVLLATDNHQLFDQMNVFQPKLIVHTVVQTAKAALELPSFQSGLQEVLDTVIDNLGEQSIQEYLQEVNMDDSWRADLEGYLSEMALQIVDLPEFQRLLTEVFE